MKIWRSGALVLLLTLSCTAHAGRFERGRDTRTAVPDEVRKDTRLYNLELSFGLNLNSGNVEQIYLHGGLAFNLAWGRSNLYALSNVVFNSFNGETKRSSALGTLRYDYSLHKRFKLFAYNTHGYSEFLKLDHRYTAGAGPWLDFDLGPFRNGLSLAVTYEYEDFDGYPTEHAARLSLRHHVTCRISDHVTAGADLFVVPRVDDFLDAHVYVLFFLDTRLWRDVLKLRVTLADEFDSRPKPGVRSNDFEFITALVLSVGQ